jgi:hypothetical protein
MKKVLFCALAALALVLTACDPNNPTNPSEINVKDYVGSTWFLDSVNMGDFTTTHMCQPIFLLSETSIQLGNNECAFRFENGKLYITHYPGESETEYELVSLDEKGAVVKAGKDDNVRTYYISALPPLDRNKQTAISESVMLGKYKPVINSMAETKLDGSVVTSYTIGGMITWITFKENNKVLYEDSNPSIESTEGCWELYAAEKKIRWGGYSSLADLREYGTKNDILVFNDDYLVTGVDYDYDASMGFTHRHYETVLVRVK